jgi:hypothetical protein
MICLARMRRDQRTKEYVARRTAEGKSKREIIRWLSSATWLGRPTACLSLAAPVARRQDHKTRATSSPGAAPLDHRPLCVKRPFAERAANLQGVL